MATVSSLVVKRRLASMRQVEDALARQTLYGGDVVTNLLEVAPPPSTDEVALTAALADALEIPPAPVDALRSPDPVAVARMPKAIAEQHGLVPIAMRDGAVLVALAEPLVSATVDELSAMIGAPILQCAAPIVRLRQALERAYGVTMDRRTRRLAAILDGKPATDAAAASRRTSIPDVADDPVAARALAKATPSQPRVVPPLLAASQSAPPPAPAPVAPTPEPPSVATPSRPPVTTIRAAAAAASSGAGALQWFVRSAKGEAASSAPGRRRRGPYTRADAERVFGDPASTDAVLAAVLEFAQQYFAYVAIFLVQEDVAEGWDAVGAGASGDRVRKMGVPLDLPSLLSTAREQRAPLVRPRPIDGLDAVVAIDLERPRSGDVVVAPVVLGKRVVALLYADDAGSSIVTTEVAEVFAVIAEAGTALARMIVRKKQKNAPLPAKPASQRPERRVDPDTVAERAGLLAKAIAGPARESRSSRPPSAAMKPPSASPSPVAPPAESAPISGPISAPPSADAPQKRFDTLPYREAVRPISTERIVSPAFPPDDTRKQPTDPMGHQLDTPTPSHESVPAADASGVALARITQPIPALRDLEDESAVTMRLPSNRPGPPSDPPRAPVAEPAKEPSVPPRAPIATPTPPPPALAGRRGLGPLIPREEPDSVYITVDDADVSDDELDDLLSLADRSHARAVEPPARESERFEVYAARQPPASRRTSEMELPKVMVAIEPEYVILVDRVVHGGDGGDRAAAQLRAHGIAALPAIMDRFPGPTRCDRTIPIAHVPTAAQAGPLLGLLVELGRLALRDILARLGDPIAETRFWAAWLLTEIVDSESAAPLVPRLVDDDLAVRRAAGIAARCLLDHHAQVRGVVDTIVEPLTGVLLDPGAPVPLRIRAACALGELREQYGVEGLILGLEAREPEIAAAVHDALVTITRQNPVARGESWPAWFAKQGQRARLEWLIDALLEEDLSLREAAALELKEKTKVYFGYYANLPLPERVLAHRRYRTWWRDEGRKLFEGSAS